MKRRDFLVVASATTAGLALNPLTNPAAGEVVARLPLPYADRKAVCFNIYCDWEHQKFLLIRIFDVDFHAHVVSGNIIKVSWDGSESSLPVAGRESLSIDWANSKIGNASSLVLGGGDPEASDFSPVSPLFLALSFLEPDEARAMLSRVVTESLVA